MLGSAIYDVFKDKYKLILTVRDSAKIVLLEKAYGDTSQHQVELFDAQKVFDDFVVKKGYPGEYLDDFIKRVGAVDYVLNAIGVCIPYAMENPVLTYFINSSLPHILALKFGTKLIHITTDCVYNGTEGFPYDENSPKTPMDIYGASKSLGEPKTCLTIRTSIIGKELEGFTGFLEWFRQQEGKAINGFSGHFWNGITTKQYAKICDQIIQKPENFPVSGLYHVFSTTVSKLQMLKTLQKKFAINCTINENPDPRLNRTLATVKTLNQQLSIPTFEQMVREL